MMSQVVYARTRRTHMSCRRFELSTLEETPTSKLPAPTRE